MKIGIFSNEYQKKEVIQNIFDMLGESNSEVYVQKEFCSQISKFIGLEGKITGIIDTEKPLPALDIALSIGGDGTFLRTVSFLRGTTIPILGINTGRLGFLADISADDTEETLAEILEGSYQVEKRTQIKLTVENSDKEYYALNEAAILKQDSASMITVTMYINDEILSSYEADGLIIATPTGSTAYSLSVGGAIIAPDTPNFIITAIAPHSLTSRPLVVADTNVLTMEVSSRTSSFLVSVDGRSEAFPVNGSVLRIEKADMPVYVVKRIGHTFYATIRNKLKWGTDPRQENGNN